MQENLENLIEQCGYNFSSLHKTGYSPVFHSEEFLQGHVWEVIAVYHTGAGKYFFGSTPCEAVRLLLEAMRADAQASQDTINGLLKKSLTD